MRIFHVRISSRKRSDVQIFVARADFWISPAGDSSDLTCGFFTCGFFEIACRTCGLKRESLLLHKWDKNFFYPKSRALSWRDEEVSSKAKHTIGKNSPSFTTLSDREVSSCTISLRQKGLNFGIWALFQNLARGEESPDKQSGSYDKLSTPFDRARLARQLLLVAKSPLALSPLRILP